MLDFGGIRVLLSGDTSHQPVLVQPLLDLKPDVAMPCINGVFGNMNYIDAARFIEQARPRYAIPCHYWTFAEQGAGDPAGFLYACRQFCPEVTTLLLKTGEPFSVDSRPKPDGERVETINQPPRTPAWAGNTQPMIDPGQGFKDTSPAAPKAK